MIPPLAEIIGSLIGALRLGLYDRSGLAAFSLTIEGFWRSFFAAALIAPAYVLIAVLELSGTGRASDLPAVIAIEAFFYVLSWTIYPVAMIYLTRLLGLSANYVSYIVAYNWSSVWRIVLFLPVAIVARLEWLSPQAAGSLVWIVMFVVLAYHWIVLRFALEADAAASSGLVVFEFLLSLLIDSARTSLLP